MSIVLSVLLGLHFIFEEKYSHNFQMAGKLRFIDFLRLCLVPIKYEGKCKGKKIQKKKKKKKVKENKKID